MKKSILISKIFGIALAFVLVGAMLPFGAFGTHSQVEASPGTIYVPDDFSTIQAAVNAASSGDTIIVRDGTYTENVNVNKDYLTIQSENGAEVTIIQSAGSALGVFWLTGVDHVTISGFTIKGAYSPSAPYYDAGVCLYLSEYCSISNNILLDNHYGIIVSGDCPNNTHHAIYDNRAAHNYIGIGLVNAHYNIVRENDASDNWVGINIFGSNNNILSDNTVSNNEEEGMRFERASSHNTVSGNAISGNGNGIFIYDSPSNTLSDNTLSGNEYGVRLYGRSLAAYVQDIDTSNKINGMPIQYLVGRRDMTIDSSWEVGYLGLVNCQNMIIEDLELKNNYQGILLAYSNNCRIQNVNVSYNAIGIDIINSSRNNIIESTIRNNIWYGISFENSSNNRLTCSVISGSHTGIILNKSSYNRLSNSIVTNNGRLGITIDYGTNNSLVGNTISDNGLGVLLESSSSYILTRNNLYGKLIIECWDPPGECAPGMIYLNNLHGSVIMDESTSVWNSPREITYTYDSNSHTGHLGNYWSDYLGNDVDGDGIGDTPYNIPRSWPSQNDNYPLMGPFENCWAEDVFDFQVEYWLDWDELLGEEQLAYPYVFTYAAEYQISPALIMAVIRQESDFNADANGNDWIGYMQVSWDAASDQGMPGAYTGTKAEWQVEGKDPNLNINYGTRFLRILNDIFEDGKFLGGSLYAIEVPDTQERLNFVLAAYNGGQGRIANAQQIATSNGQDPTKWQDVKDYLEDAGATPSKAQEIRNYVCQGKVGRDLIEGVHGEEDTRGYDFFLTVRVPQNPIIMAHLCSPAELRVYDSGAQITGLVDGVVRNEIPYSIYHDNTVTVFSPTDTYRYEVAAIGNGLYGLTVTNISEDQSITFTATDIPATLAATHRYTIDWSAVSQGEEGVTVKIDANGDGIFERTISSDSELTHDEFVLQTETTIDFDPDTLKLKDKGKYVTSYIELPEGYDVEQIDVSSVRLNDTIPALSWPTTIGDHNNNGIPDLMVKFDRREVQAVVEAGESVDITVTGEVDGIPFMGTDIIRVIGA